MKSIEAFFKGNQLKCHLMTTHAEVSFIPALSFPVGGRLSLRFVGLGLDLEFKWRMPLGR